MRATGIIKSSAVIVIDFILLSTLLDIRWALGICFMIVLYGVFGEHIDLWRDGAIAPRYVPRQDQLRLDRVRAMVSNSVQTHSHVNVTHVHLHIIPSQQINAFAYGTNHIGITRGALNACDDMTLTAVLSHEMSHTLCMDAVFHRLIFANVTMIIFALIAASFISVSFMWLFFLGLCIMGLCGGFVSIFVAHGVSRGIGAFFTVMQHLVLFIYQVVMNAVSRGCEYRADAYAAELGYGPQLCYFLRRFVPDQERQQSLSELLYASHPATYRRIHRIEERTHGQLSVPR